MTQRPMHTMGSELKNGTRIIWPMVKHGQSEMLLELLLILTKK